jgi:hypothetical protein
LCRGAVPGLAGDAPGRGGAGLAGSSLAGEAPDRPEMTVKLVGVVPAEVAEVRARYDIQQLTSMAAGQPG